MSTEAPGRIPGKRVAVAGCALACLWLATVFPAQAHQRPDELAASAADVRSVLADTPLVDQDGRPFTLGALDEGRPILLSFFFTECRDVCPVQTRQLGELQARLRESPGGEPSMFLSISLDPANDTPERLRDYAAKHAIDFEDWTFATGTAFDIGTLAASMWASDGDAGSGLPDHRMIVHLLDADLRPVQRYTAEPIDVVRLERELEAFARAEARRR